MKDTDPNDWEETLTQVHEIPNAYAAYAGVYQAYAWHQGFANAPYMFGLPDEHFWPTPFVLAEFMAVVADMDDEGHVHLWRYITKGDYEFLTLVCTEDDSMRGIDENLDGYYHASSPVWFSHIP